MIGQEEKIFKIQWKTVHALAFFKKEFDKFKFVSCCSG
jgi:hypothetical protein